MNKILFLLVLTSLAWRGAAVEIGDTLDQVVAEKGQPDNKLQAGGTTILTYAGDTIKLKNGKVVEMKTAAEVANSGTTLATPAIAAGAWTTDYPAALAQARSEEKQVFLFFTGSDWCSWCKRLDREILSTPQFKSYATDKLILVLLDFPRRSPQPAQLKARNRQLAAKYHIDGYPTVIVLDSSGNQIGELGYMEGGPAGFLKRLSSF